jgi:hypothetical protein
MSSSLLPIWSAGHSARFYSTMYLAMLESHSPFRLKLLTKLRNKLVACAGPLNRIFENCLDRGEEEDGMASLILANCCAFQS